MTHILILRIIFQLIFILYVLFSICQYFCVFFSTLNWEKIMLTYETIKMLCKKKGVTVTGTEKALGFSRGSLCKVDTSKPSMEKVQKLADYFGVTVDYLMTGNAPHKEKAQGLTAKDERDIAKDLNNIMQKLTSWRSRPRQL